MNLLKNVISESSTADSLSSPLETMADATFGGAGSFPLILLFVMTTIFIAVFCSLMLGIDISATFLNPMNWIPARKAPAQIAYKKANLQIGSSHFAGVTHTRYQADDSSNGPGFHAYDTFEQALAHPQEGNVILEVLLSGKITKMDLGFIATRQRVLQVMPHKCSSYSCQNVPNSFELLDGHIYFYCQLHGLSMVGLSLVVRVAKFFGAYGDDIRFLPLSKLPEVLPWLEDHKIVVSSTRGKNKFTPTVISENVNSIGQEVK